MRTNSLLNHNVFFWCTGPLGLRTLHLLVELRQQVYPLLKIGGIGVYTHDELNQEIITVAQKNWPKVGIFYDRFQLGEHYDLGLMIGFPFKLSPTTIDQFENGIVNLHQAPLPYYRGFGCLEHAILRGDDRYGVSLHFVDTHLNTGPIIDRAWCPLPSDATYRNMMPILEQLSFGLICQWLQPLLTQLIASTPQTDLIQREQLTPLFFSKTSVANLYCLNKSRSFTSLYRYTGALDNGAGCKPYIEHDEQRLYLSLSDR
jgi:methionyl-tRNA formyltransferase